MEKQFRLESRRALFVALGLRLLLVGALMAALVGVISYRTMTADFVDRIHDMTKLNVGYLNQQILPLLEGGETPTARQLALELERFNTGNRGHNAKGRFVLVNFYGPQGERLLEVVRDLPADLSQVRKRLEQIPILEEVIVRQEEIGAKSYVLAVFPLLDSAGEKRLYVLGIFEPSAEVVALLEGRILRNLLLVVAIIFLTTLLLYPLLIRLFGRVQELSSRLMQSNLETLMVLGSAIAKRDSDTDIHNFRVTVYAVHLAQEIGLGSAEMQSLIKGAFLHDVGKIGIHDRILLKPGPLDEEEFAEMKRHVAYGQEIVARSAWLADALPVVRYHHEKIDGSGYLAGIAGEEIPIIARIFAIVDVFDALTARRPYKEPFPLEEALSIMLKGSGQHFDSELLQHFSRLAADLHRRFASADSAEMQRQLDELVGRYFMLK